MPENLTRALKLDIRAANSWDDYLQCEQLQMQVWRLPDPRDIVPAHLLITAQKNGGLLLGAFDGPRMVGFVFGFLGIEANDTLRQIKHCSHMLAVLESYRGVGLGLELKKKQRECLIEQGIDLATWTYDPLLSVNARLNLSRLGAVSRRYIRNAYGKMTDGLNAGIASDRFEVEWWLKSKRAQERILRAGRENESMADAQSVYSIEFSEEGLPRVTSAAVCGSEVCLVEIPTNFTDLKLRDSGLARDWRNWTRATFEGVFSKGYTAIDLRKWKDEAGRSRMSYVIAKSVPDNGV